MDQAALEAAVLRYTMQSQEFSLQTYIANNPWVLVNFVMFIVLVVVVNSMVFFIKRRREVTTMMNVDSVTGMMTEHKFLEEARKILKEDPVGRYRLATLDIDNFKYMNELYGYETGTELLKILGQCMSQRVGDGTIVARGTADRFMALAPMVENGEAIAWIEDDIEAIHEILRNRIGKGYKLYFSTGVYEICDREHDIAVMLDYANIACQQSKLRAGSSIKVFTEQMQKEIATNNYLTSIMEQALEGEEFVLYYQPKLDINAETVVGAEVLVRWIKEGSVMPPNQFIPLFEKNGFIENLDYYVLAHTCAFLQMNSNRCIPRLSVNLSSVSMLQPDVVQNILDIVAKYNIVPAQIDLEITETAFVENGAVLERLGELREHGFTISMDDFGTGVSSLNRLKNMQLDTLKIDREFIIDSLENPRGSKILKHVVDMARDLNLETVAEGIETDEQRNFLKEIGCDVGQGYFYACPLPETEFLMYCNEHCPVGQ